MHSMTGFGRAEKDSKLGKLTVEISSINSRFRELSVRLPRSLSALEPQVREQLAADVSRGKVILVANLEEPDDSADRFTINKVAAKAYYRQLKQLQKELKLSGEIAISDLLQFPDLAKPTRETVDPEKSGDVFSQVCALALKRMLAMRAKEGQALARDMKQRLRKMSALIGEVEKLTVGAVKIYAEKLAARIEELLGSARRDSARLEEEIAVFAERTDIAEECTRFRSHLEQFRGTLQDKDAVGRRLNFILQEMNREVNTIGSKCAEFDISTHVISLKEEIEKLREQVQNVE